MEAQTYHEIQDLKSRKALTDLLHEQIDLNEEISYENYTLNNQQKQLLLLLENKDSQLNQYKTKLQSGDSIKNYLYERSLKLSILESIYSKIQFKHVKQTFDCIRLIAVHKQGTNFKLQTLSKSYHDLSKKRFIKALNKLRLKRLLSGFFEENNEQRRRAGFNFLHVFMLNHNKTQMLNSFCALRLRAVHEQQFQQTNIVSVETWPTVALLKEDRACQMITETISSATNTENTNNSSEGKALIMSITLRKITMRIMMDALREIELKPVQRIAAKFSHLKNMTKKFLAISSIFNLMRRMKAVNNARAFQNLTTYSFKQSIVHRAHEVHCKSLAKLMNKLSKKSGFSTLKEHLYKAQLMYRLSDIYTTGLLRESFNKLKIDQEPLHFAALRNITNIPKESNEWKFTDIFVIGRENPVSVSISTQQRTQNTPKRKSVAHISYNRKKKTNKTTQKHGIIHRFYNKKVPVLKGYQNKGRYHILLKKYKKNIKGYSSQMKIYLGQMQSKVQNFQRLNENLIEEARESRQKLEDYQKTSVTEFNKKEYKYRYYIEELENKLQNVQSTGENQASINSALKNKLSATVLQTTDYERKIVNLTNTIDELAQDKGELLEKCQELMQSLTAVRREFQKNQEAWSSSSEENRLLKNELDETIQAHNKLKNQYVVIEEEMADIRKLTERKGLTSSQNVKKDASGLKDSIKRLKKDKQDTEDELNNVTQQIMRLKATNSELTKETINLNEERIQTKGQISRLTESNTALRRDLAQVEEKVKFLSKSLEEKKALLASKIINDKATPDYINQILDEKKTKDNENAMLKAKIAKMNELIGTYDNNHARQADELMHSEKELYNLREEKKSIKKDMKEVNETVANLNKDKVNLMREMSRLQDENQKLDGDTKKYKQIVEEMQNEISNYQMQMDMYAKVLKTMEAKMARIDNKAKLISKTPLNDTAASTDIDPDDQELFNRIKSIRNKFNSTFDTDITK